MPHPILAAALAGFGLFATSVSAQATTTKSLKITDGGHAVRGDNEIDSDDWTQVAVSYDIVADASRQNASIEITLDAYECNDDKTYGDTHLRLKKKLALYSAPPGKKIRQIKGVAMSGTLSEYFKGKRHGPQSFEGKVGSLAGLTFTFDGKGRDDHKKMNLSASLSFIPVLK